MKIQNKPQTLAYFSLGDNDHSEEQKASTLRFFSEKSEDKNEEIFDKLGGFNTMKFNELNFKNLAVQSKATGRLKGKPVELTLITERQSAEEDQDDDHDSREIRAQKSSHNEPLEFYYHRSAFFTMSDRMLSCFDKCDVHNYVAIPVVLRTMKKSVKWGDYWAVQFFGSIPSELVARYRHKVFIEHKTDFMFFDQTVRDALASLGIKYLTVNKHLFKYGIPRSKKIQLWAAEKKVVDTLLKKY
jgi:hypothetical protein